MFNIHLTFQTNPKTVVQPRHKCTAQADIRVRWAAILIDARSGAPALAAKMTLDRILFSGQRLEKAYSG